MLRVITLVFVTLFLQLLPGLSGAGSATAAEEAPANVILITLDGVRWQEIFYGPDLSISPALGGQGAGGAERAMPLFWANLALDGVLFGDVSGSIPMYCANLAFKSLPAYHSITAGKVQDCPDNECGRIKVETIQERLVRELGLSKLSVATIASWDKLRLSAEQKSGATFTNAWFDLVNDGESDAELARLNRDQIIDKPSWLYSRYDKYTFAQAMRYLRVHRPRFLFISLNDTDDLGHLGDYRGYLDALKNYDRWLTELVAELAKMGDYGKSTSIILTTDHGRGEGNAWKNHGEGVPASRFIWLYGRSPLTIARAEQAGVGANKPIDPSKPYSHVDIRPTIEALMGLKPTTIDTHGAGYGRVMREISGHN